MKKIFSIFIALSLLVASAAYAGVGKYKWGMSAAEVSKISGVKNPTWEHQLDPNVAKWLYRTFEFSQDKLVGIHLHVIGDKECAELISGLIEKYGQGTPPLSADWVSKKNSTRWSTKDTDILFTNDSRCKVDYTVKQKKSIKDHL